MIVHLGRTLSTFACQAAATRYNSCSTALTTAWLPTAMAQLTVDGDGDYTLASTNQYACRSCYFSRL